MEELAREFKMSLKEFQKALNDCHEELKKCREKRPRPHLVCFKLFEVELTNNLGQQNLKFLELFDD